MSESPVLPFPTVSEIWAAQNGRLFFLKWMMLSVVSVILMTDTSIIPVTVAELAIAVQPIALFGFRWRLWVWVAATMGATFLLLQIVTLTYMLHFVFIATGIVQMPFLVGIRQRPFLWPVAVATASFINWLILRTSIYADLSNWVVGLLFGNVGMRWAIFQLNAGLQLTTAAILGAALAWLMPAVDPSESASE